MAGTENWEDIRRNKKQEGGGVEREEAADDLIIVAKSEREMKEIMKNLGTVCEEEKAGSEC
jgi:hypothetical protein